MPKLITAAEGLNFPMPIYERLKMSFAFACPTCQLRGKLVVMNTDDALQMHWDNAPGDPTALRVTWTGCVCPTCNNSFTMEARRAMTNPALLAES